MSHVKKGRTSDGKDWVFYVDLGCDAEEVWQSIQREALEVCKSIQRESLEVTPPLKGGPPDFQAELEPGDPPWVEPLFNLALGPGPGLSGSYEWWAENSIKKLTIYNDYGKLTFVAVWGWCANMHTQMKDGTLEETSFRTLWDWLHNPEKTL